MHSWSRGDKIAAIGVIATIVFGITAIYQKEIRLWLGADPSSIIATPSIGPASEPSVTGITKPGATTSPELHERALALMPPLSSASFETVTLDAWGKEVIRRKLQAEYFTEDLNGVLLEVVKIPGGTFEMGSPNSEPLRDNNEGPQHSVTVSEFFMGRFEVTREQWRRVARIPRVKIDLNEDPAYFKDSLKQPVEQVNWEEAVEFCERLKKKTGRPCRLPSEALEFT